jgi:hypothetical protein
MSKRLHLHACALTRVLHHCMPCPPARGSRRRNDAPAAPLLDFAARLHLLGGNF